MDVLPAQVSAGPVFSSSKETCALQDNCLGPMVLKGLQVLKFLHKKNQVLWSTSLHVKKTTPSLGRPLLMNYKAVN